MYGQYIVPKADEMINFGIGQPNNDFLPMDLIKKGMRDFLDCEEDKSILQYGDKAGYESFRKILAEFISGQICAWVDPNELFVTNGVTGALNLICSVLDKKTIFIVEDPTYFLALNIFRDYGYKIHIIDMNKPYIEQVTEILEIYKDELIDMVLYTIPTFQNPTNYTMPDEIRKELVALTHKYKNFMIIADEVYQYLYFDKKPPLPLHYYDGRVISIGSFSKILAPGLRLGWIQTKVEFMKKFNDCGLMESGGALNALACRIVYPLLNYDLIDKYIDSCRYFLKTRGEYMFEQLSEHLSEHCEFYKPNGGYFIWIRMKKDINTKTMLDIAIKNKVKYHYGEKFSSAVDANRYFRLSFSWYDQADILEGILRIKKTIEEL